MNRRTTELLRAAESLEAVLGQEDVPTADVHRLLERTDRDFRRELRPRRHRFNYDSLRPQQA